METFSQPPQTIDLATHLYYQLVYTLTDLLPPPLDDTPAALRTRNHAAIAKVAALLPVNANEADLAAQCIAARAQAEEMLRLIRQNADDIQLVMRLNAQYGSMVRTSLSAHARLMRVQAVRQKREAIEGAANQDAWAQHIAERSMLGVVNPDAGPHQAAWPEPALTTNPDPRIEHHVSEDDLNSQDAAFETWLSNQPWNQRSDETGQTVHEAIARSSLASHELPTNSRASPARPG
ncbi:hypothetical protein [Acidisphaera sp. S103]|uniref:hypothetical protein n=1 Tax=Acidisphaera sp. S103 TaxID=1747223 RepID=UPI00131CCD93|nr:hypothetical protein [Acidisphaera sp. S103]